MYSYRYPRPAVTADAVILTSQEPRKILLIERRNDPYKGCWAFPGGFLEMDETVEQCAIRELKEETGMELGKMHQIGVYSRVDRDPRDRVISVAFLALVQTQSEVKAMDDAKEARWWSVDEIPQLAFDHKEILEDALKLAAHVAPVRESNV